MGGSLSCLWTWEGLRHLPSHSSRPLFAPFTRTLLPHSSPNLFRGSPSNSQQGAAEPSFAFSRLHPFHHQFPLAGFPAPTAQPHRRVARDSRPRASMLPLGHVPLAYLLSNNPMGSGALVLSPPCPASEPSPYRLLSVLRLQALHWVSSRCWGGDPPCLGLGAAGRQGSLAALSIPLLRQL